MIFANKKLVLPALEEALPGRSQAMRVNSVHFVTGKPVVPPFPDVIQKALFGLGCFWGAERKFWQIPKVFSTAVGYSGGFTPNPTYEEVCTGLTGHNEVVLVLFDPSELSYATLLEVFWEAHDPTQGMRQGNDKGTQYRSGIYTFSEEQMSLAQATKQGYQQRLAQSGFGQITTEIVPAREFYYAEDYHQQYLAKEPNGYCGLGGTGIKLMC